MPREKRAEISRENGRRNDGSKMLGISNAERKAIAILREEEEKAAEERRLLRIKTRHVRENEALSAAEKLGEKGFRIRRDMPDQEMKEAATTLGKFALTRMTDALMGKVSKDKINATLKSAIAVREEVCDPLVKESKITGALTLEQMVAAAAKKAGEVK